MSNLTSAINVQVNKEDKDMATKILNDLGISMSTAINIFVKQIIKHDGLPFEVKNPRPSKELKEALKEGNKISKEDNRKRYNSVAEMMDAILDD